MLFQIYDYYRTVYGSEKGQDLIEYANMHCFWHSLSL